MLEQFNQRLEAVATEILLQTEPNLNQLAAWKETFAEVKDWARVHAEPALRQAAAACLDHLGDSELGAAIELTFVAEDLVGLLSALQEQLEEVRSRLNPQGDGAAAAIDDAAMVNDPEIVAEFLSEGLEQLEESDNLLLTIEKDPTNDEAINALFRCFHTVKGLAGFLNLRDIETLAHATEDLLDQARRGERRLEGDAVELIFNSIDLLKKLLHSLETSESDGAQTGPSPGKLAHHIGRLRAIVEDAEAPSQGTARPRAGSSLQRTSAQSQTDAGESGSASTSDGDGDARSRPAETVRVASERLDLLVDLIGELVITESMVQGTVDQGEQSGRAVRRHLNRMEKITRELQELAGSLRMVPVRATFRKMTRLARDVARKSGKNVDFRIRGEDTELDKTVVDRIAEPLVHLVRNAIDHGLESDPEERIALGKSEVGRVELRAFHKGGNIHVEIEDDGRGLDRKAIHAKALANGLAREGETISDRELLQLVCAPGFSTAKKITSISGRGVGMDVVKRQIDTMGGSLEITSEIGKGTCFSMHLPLTLAVIDGMVVRIGSERYIVPTLSVVRLVTLRPDDCINVLSKGEVLSVQGELVSVLRLERLFNLPPLAKETLALIADADGHRVAVFIEELVGQQQAVVKGLGEGLGEIPGLTGCAILSDGRVGLVLDVASLSKLAATAPYGGGRSSAKKITSAMEEGAGA